MRQPEQRKDRACIRPEISRTRTFGKIGVSKYVKKSLYKKTHFILDFILQRNVLRQASKIHKVERSTG